MYRTAAFVLLASMSFFSLLGCADTTRPLPPNSKEAAVDKQDTGPAEKRAGTASTTAAWDTKVGDGVVAIKLNAERLAGVDEPMLLLELWTDKAGDVAVNELEIGSKSVTGKPYKSSGILQPPPIVSRDKSALFVLREIRQSTLLWAPRTVFQIKVVVGSDPIAREFSCRVPASVNYPAGISPRDARAVSFPELKK